MNFANFIRWNQKNKFNTIGQLIFVSSSLLYKISIGFIFLVLASIAVAQTSQITNIPVNVVNPNPHIEDIVLAQSIKKKIQLDARIAAAKFDIKVNNGVVSLLGNFNTAQEAAAAIEDISATPGVVDINVSGVVLLTGTESNFTDVVTAARIKGLFVRDSIFGQIPVSSINIEIRDGIVYLSGTVDSIAQANKARELARSVPNVNDVTIRFIIKNP